MVEQMNSWPKKWAGDKVEEIFGEKLMTEMKPFVLLLIDHGYAKSTMNRHLNHLFLPGGEIVRMVSMDDEYDADPAVVLRDSVEEEGGMLCQHLYTEAPERAYDATCRKLHHFLESQK